MVNILIGNKNTNEVDILYQRLANDKNFNIKNVTTGNEIISSYVKLQPDILILDDNLTDITINDIVDKLSQNFEENNKCNTILTIYKNSITKLTNFKKINTVIYKPLNNDKLIEIIKELSIKYNTPNLKVREIECILTLLNITYMSPRIFIY